MGTDPSSPWDDTSFRVQCAYPGNELVVRRWMIAQNWSVRGEYLYVGLGTANVNSTLVNTDHINGGSLSTTAVVTSARFNENIARGALNYHF